MTFLFYYLFGIGLLGIAVPFLFADALFLNKRNKTMKTKIDENFKNSYKKFKEKYIYFNIYLIRKKAESYNKIINEFNNFIKEYENENTLIN